MSHLNYLQKAYWAESLGVDMYKYSYNDLAYLFYSGATPGATTMTGSYLFLVDSLSAGPGNIYPHPYYIGKLALEDERLRRIWVPLDAATSTQTDTILSTEGSWSVSSSSLAPQVVLANDGTDATSDVLINTFTFPWDEAIVYYEESTAAASFDAGAAGFEVTVDITGTDGTVSSTTVANTSGDTMSSLCFTNATAELTILGVLFVCDSSLNASDDYVDVINFAVSGKEIAEWVSDSANQVWWTSELDVDKAIINAGTNDNSYGYTTALQSYTDMMDALIAGTDLTGEDILTLHPADSPDVQLGDMWEDIRDAYSTPYASIAQSYGSYATFNANGWMSDTVHPTSEFNEILAEDLYNNDVEDLQAAFDGGDDPRWHTILGTTTVMVIPDSGDRIAVSGDFEMEVLFRPKMNSYNHLVDGHNGTFDNRILIELDGSITVTIAGSSYTTSSSGLFSAGTTFYKMTLTRSGTTITLDLTGADGSNYNEVLSTAGTTGDYRVGRWGGSSGGQTGGGVTAYCWIKGLHLWEFDQTLEDDAVVDLIGGVDAEWRNRQEGVDYMTKYSQLDDGLLLDWHRNATTSIDWGDFIWPSTQLGL